MEGFFPKCLLFHIIRVSGSSLQGVLAASLTAADFSLGIFAVLRRVVLHLENRNSKYGREKSEVTLAKVIAP